MPASAGCRSGRDADGKDRFRIAARSKCPGAPVDWSRDALRHGSASGLVVNSGNANAFTGAKGRGATKQTARIAAGILGASRMRSRSHRLVSSASQLDAGEFVDVVPAMATNCRSLEEAVKAIMTTDTFPKGSFRTAYGGDATVPILVALALERYSPGGMPKWILKVRENWA